MKKFRWFLILAIVMIVAGVGNQVWSTRAASNTSFSASIPGYTANYTPDVDDGDGYDWVCVVCYDATGAPTDVDTPLTVGVSMTPGAGPQTWMDQCDAMLGGAPVTAAFGDPNTPRPTTNDNNAANVTWCVTAATNPDSDGDGVPDDQDQCPGHDDNVDVDNDGIPDGCDPLIDSDGDGVGDDQDICPGHDDNVDVDNDGIPDGCDPLIDSDDDGVGDDQDVCEGGDDAVDVDGDGIPDACDPKIDTDNDGIADHNDMCPDEVGLVGAEGCPDVDADGTPDILDDCPNQAGPRNNTGCPLPGCDILVYVPDTAVVGTFTADAMLYWHPSPEGTVFPTLTVFEGQSLWVDGVDVTGQYRRVLLSCRWLWVEAAKVGPTYPYPWFGMALPMHVAN